MNHPKLKTAPDFFAAIACIAGALVFTSAYVAAEHPIYHGDYLLYYAIYKSFAQTFVESWTHGLLNLKFAISHDYYNPSSIIPLLPIAWFLGDDRVYYVAGIVLIYLTPAAFIAARIAQADATPIQRPGLPTLFAAFLFPVFWMPTLRGMVDIAGLVPLGLATLLLHRTDYLSKAHWKDAVVLGLLLWCAFLFRRWYAFSIVALVMAAVILNVAIATWRRSPIKGTITAISVKYGIAAAIALLAAVLVQPLLINRILLTSYTNAYAAFQRDLPSQLQIYYDHLGFCVLAFVTIGLIVAIMQRRTLPLFCACVAVLTAVLFARVQAPDRHHILPIALFLFPAYFAGLAHVMQRLMTPPVAASVMGIVACMNFLSTFVPFGWGVAEPLRTAFPRAYHAPLRLQAFEEYKRLATDLKNLEPDTTIAIFASSGLLAHDMIESIEPALEPRIKTVAAIDNRDGFLWSILGADHAVIGVPTPIGLNPGSQRVIEYPTQSIRAGTGIGAAFMDTGRAYHLDGGVTAHLYKRLRAVTADEISDLANRFYEVYPDWRKRQADVGFGLASARIVRSDSKADVQQVGPAEVTMLSGKTQPTSITFRLDRWFRPRTFKISLLDIDLRPCGDDARLSFAFGGDGAEAATRVITGAQTVEAPTPTGDELQITVFPAPQLRCEIGLIQFDFGDVRR